MDVTFLTSDEMANLAYLGGYHGPLPKPNMEKNGKPLYTGKQLFSLFLPKDFNFIIASKWNKLLKNQARML